MKLSDGFNGADLRNVCTEAGWGFKNFIFDQPSVVMYARDGFMRRYCRVMVGALDSGLSGPDSSPFLENCFVFLGKTLNSINECLSPPGYPPPRCINA